MYKEGDHIICADNEYVVLNTINGFSGTTVIALNPKTNDRHELAVADIVLKSEAE